MATGLMARALNASGTAAFLIVPLGATAFLLFAVPNSPLAQPWSAVVGNVTSALVAIGTIAFVPDPRLAAALAVLLAILSMMSLRAMHPPGGAVALLIALNANAVRPVGLTYVLSPVLLDTLLLVGLAIVWNRLTGRRYPFRQPPDAGPHGTHDPVTERRLGLSAAELAQILQNMNLAANIGPEDLARLIGVAEAEAAAHHLGGLTAADVMSRDLITAPPDAHPDALTALFRTHRFKMLPIVGADQRYLGLLSQTDLLGLTDAAEIAEHLMNTAYTTAHADIPIAALLVLLADGIQQTVPVLEGHRLVGLVTRTDMIAALAYALRG